MARWQALLVKELREHWLAALGLAALLAFGLLVVILGTVLQERTVTAFEAATAYLVTFLPLGGIVLGHRLVVQEYHGRTQLFLEGLPVRRFEMVAVKFLLGLGVLLLTAFGALAVIALVAARTEPVGARFAGILSARAAGFAAWLWCFLFFMGFMGRFRIAIYLGIGLGLSAIAGMTDFELQRFGPFALLDPQTFSTERERMPWGALAETAVLSAGLAGAAALVALVREGSLAETLARRMSQKEKAAIGILFVAVLVALTVLDQRRTKAPFEFSSTAVVSAERAPVTVMYGKESAYADAVRVRDGLEAEIVALRAALGWESVPATRVALREDLDGDRFETAVMQENDGVLVRANFRARPDWDAAAFTTHVVRELIDAHTHGRARFEPRRWLHDGFARWWAERETSRPVGPSSRAWLRGVWTAREAPPSAADLTAWDRLRERRGERVAEGLAYLLLLELESASGRDAVLALARAEYGRIPERNVGEWFHERSHPPAGVFRSSTGLEWEAFLARWRASVVRALADPQTQEALAPVPSGRAELDLVPGAGRLRSVAWRFDFAVPPPAGTACALLHLPLSPFDHELQEPTLRREEHPWPADLRAAGWTLHGRYGPGQRAFFALEVDCAILGCPVRLLAERREVP